MNSPIYSVYQAVKRVKSYLPRKCWTPLTINKQQVHIGSLAFLKWAPRKKTICDLPDECLANIFDQTMCRSGHHNYKPPSTLFFLAECRQDPFLLRQVCRKWRNVTPPLTLIVNAALWPPPQLLTWPKLQVACCLHRLDAIRSPPVFHGCPPPSLST
jgi:hypothetical protein